MTFKSPDNFVVAAVISIVPLLVFVIVSSFCRINPPEPSISKSVETITLPEPLGEIEIFAEETSVEIRLDKKIYTVGKDLTVRGGTGTDVLDNIPSVSTDIDGNILLRGNDAARILINGKPSRLVGVNSSFI